MTSNSGHRSTGRQGGADVSVQTVNENTRVSGGQQVAPVTRVVHMQYHISPAGGSQSLHTLARRQTLIFFFSFVF